MSEKLLLIDGHSILNRAFYGVPELTNSKGIHTNAVYGFLNILFKVLEEEKPDYLIVAFDLKEKTFRHKMFEEYKGTRKPMPVELHEQVPIIREVLSSMNITTISKAGYEADDILGTLAFSAEKAGLIVRVISGDRDLLQLATKNIMIRIPKTKKGTTEIENYLWDDVISTYQVNPKQFIDLKALMGDTADNIPGVTGIGEKTATKIITSFDSVENAYSHIDEITPPKAQNSLRNEYDIALLSKKLATIDVNVPLDITYADGKTEDMFNSNAYEKISELEFKSLMAKFSSKGASSKEEINIKDSIIEITNALEYKKMLNTIKDGLVIGLHIENLLCETYEQLSFDFLNENKPDTNITIIALSCEDTIFIIDSSILKEVQIKTVKEDLINVLSTKAISLFNLKKQLKNIDLIENDKIFDCEVAAYLVNPLKDTYTYEDISRDYLEVIVTSKESLEEKKKHEDLYKTNRHNLIMLISYYAYIANKAYSIENEKLKSLDMRELYYNIELPLVFSLNRMENYGIKVDGAALKEYGASLAVDIERLTNEIYLECGTKFNINSPKQLGEILFDKMGIEGGKKTKTGYSTSADVLEKLKNDYPFVAKILEYRTLTKLKSTYADGLFSYIQEDGRIHGTFNQTITATGRISSTEPNLQNIPIRMPIGAKIREVFVPKEGYTFVDADYSQIELRILAHMSNDESLIDAYNSDMDIHRITASKVFKTPLEEVTKQQRSNAKAVNFGIVYGISSFGLSNDLSISIKEANEYINQYFETYPKIKEYLDKEVAFAKEHGYVTTMFKRRRPIPEIKSNNFMQRSFGERIAMNSPIQGTAADIMKIAMINVDKKLQAMKLDSHIVVQVHDELLIETKLSEIDIVKDILVKEMSNAAKLKVKLEIGVEAGKNWLVAH